MVISCDRNSTGGNSDSDVVSDRNSTGGNSDSDVVSDRNSTGGDCDSDVVGDYNDVAFACRRVKVKVTDKNINSCKSKAQSFLDKYPNINCKAEQPSDTSVDPDTITITPSKFEDMIKKFEELGY